MSFDSTPITLKAGQWTVSGISVGGIHTTIAIPELRVCFDIGVITTESTHCDKVLISHGHVDHCQSYFKHLRCRKLRNMHPAPIYVVPEILHKPLMVAARAQFNMEKGLLNVGPPRDFINIHTLKPDGEPLEFNRCTHSTCYIYAYPMTHRIPALGYTIVSEVPKLKPEYIGRPGREIKELRESGANIFEIRRTIEVAYTGDTTIAGVLAQPEFLKAKVLFIECTILDDQLTPSETRKRGHIHIQDLVENWQAFENEHIILFHMSPRYVGNMAHELVHSAFVELPKEFQNKIQILWPYDKNSE